MCLEFRLQYICKPLLNGIDLLKDIAESLERLDLLNDVGSELPLGVVDETLVKVGAEHVSIFDESQVTKIHAWR